MTDDRILDDEHGLEIHRGDALSPAAAAAVTEAARWGKYYLYLLLAYLVLSLGFQLVTVGLAGAAAGGVDEAAGAGAALGIVPLLFGVLFLLAFYAYPLLKFWTFAHETPRALAADSQGGFVRGVDSLRSVFKYIGVIFLAIVALYALLFIGVIVLGGIGALAD